MIEVTKIINNTIWKDTYNDEIVLSYNFRVRRRIKMTSKKGKNFLLNEVDPVYLKDGSLLILSNDYKVKIIAELEKVMKIETSDYLSLLRISWHIGNRHIPAEIHEKIIIIEYDLVLKNMLENLGAKVSFAKLPFSPLNGAYHKDNGA